jgi:uncharacterized protein YecE (DUF72 family)
MKRIVGKRFPVRLVRRERQEIDQAIGDVVGPGGLGSFLTLLPEHRRHSFEFRHPSWYAPNILRMLADRNIALCISDHHDAPAPWERTADFVYLRGHGPRGRYEGRYSRATLAAWRKSTTWQQSDCAVYVYFDNDQKSAAPMDALGHCDI